MGAEVGEMSSSELAGLWVLIVEDDPIIALDVAQTLADAGAIVVGPAHSVAQALRLVDGGGLDAAVLDYRLEREVSSPIADWLGRMSVPYLFHTSSRMEPQAAYPHVPIIDKPTLDKQDRKEWVASRRAGCRRGSCCSGEQI
jgi:CheY-like chemotaxis protein